MYALPFHDGEDTVKAGDEDFFHDAARPVDLEFVDFGGGAEAKWTRGSELEA